MVCCQKRARKEYMSIFIDGFDPSEKFVPQPLGLFSPKPGERTPGWITKGDQVLFVIIDPKGKPRIRTGHICSSPGSHGAGWEVDNVQETIVWCDQVLNDCAGCADDTYEKSFVPSDPRLI